MNSIDRGLDYCLETKKATFLEVGGQNTLKVVFVHRYFF